MVSRFEPVLSENRYRVSVKVVIMVKVILVIFRFGDVFSVPLYKYNKLYLYSESERECEILFDLNDQ